MPTELIFILTAVTVIVAGGRLALDGDKIADRTGLSAGWIGAILVAGATSLPEVATDVAAVQQGEPALAIGDLFGSSMANMLILGAADLTARQTRLMLEVATTQATIGVLAIALTAIAAAGVLAGDMAVLGYFGWPSLAIAGGYVLGMRLIYKNRGDKPSSSDDDQRAEKPRKAGLRGPIIGFALSAAAILVAAPFLASSAGELARQWGISSGFFGMVFLAAATSLPELAVVVAAMRTGAYALVVGNMFGSNCFNMLIFPILDGVDGDGSLLAAAEPDALAGATFAILMMAQALLDLLNRSERRVWYLEPGPALLVVTYAAGLLITYQVSH